MVAGDHLSEHQFRTGHCRVCGTPIVAEFPSGTSVRDQTGHVLKAAAKHMKGTHPRDYDPGGLDEKV